MPRHITKEINGTYLRMQRKNINLPNGEIIKKVARFWTCQDCFNLRHNTSRFGWEPKSRHKTIVFWNIPCATSSWYILTRVGGTYFGNINLGFKTSSFFLLPPHSPIGGIFSLLKASFKDFIYFQVLLNLFKSTL